MQSKNTSLPPISRNMDNIEVPDYINAPCEDRRPVGRPAGEPHTLINFRIPEKLRDELKKKYPKTLNAKMIEFLKSLL
jgi:hypothetical protein